MIAIRKIPAVAGNTYVSQAYSESGLLESRILESGLLYRAPCFFETIGGGSKRARAPRFAELQGCRGVIAGTQVAACLGV